jgi:hypothetical protein
VEEEQGASLILAGNEKKSVLNFCTFDFLGFCAMAMEPTVSNLNQKRCLLPMAVALVVLVIFMR